MLDLSEKEFLAHLENERIHANWEDWDLVRKYILRTLENLDSMPNVWIIPNALGEASLRVGRLKLTSVTIRPDYAQLIKFDKGQLDKRMLLAMMGKAATDDED